MDLLRVARRCPQKRLDIQPDVLAGLKQQEERCQPLLRSDAVRDGTGYGGSVTSEGLGDYDGLY